MNTLANLTQSGISVVLGSYNRKKYLALTVDSIRNEFSLSDIPYEIIVIDGGSTDGTINWLISQKDIITIVQYNRGEWMGSPIPRRSWGFFINLGFKSAHGKYICMLSDDCLVIPGAIKNGYHLFEKKRQDGKNVGAVAFYWRDWPIMDKYSVHTFYGLINVNHGLFLREAMEKVGFADEVTYNFYYGDVDLTYKFYESGYSVIASDDSFIEHYLHANISSRAGNNLTQLSDKQAFITKWKKKKIPIIDWNRGEGKYWLVFDDQSKTANYFYPFNRMFRISQSGLSLIRTLINVIGPNRLNKFQPNWIKDYVNNSNNTLIKSIQFFLFSLSLNEDREYLGIDTKSIDEEILRKQNE